MLPFRIVTFLILASSLCLGPVVVAKEKKDWGLLLELEHDMGFIDNYDQSTVASALYSYATAADLKLYAYQQIVKIYEKDIGESDLQLQDTKLYFKYRVARPKSSGVDAKLKFGVTLPTSDKSQELDLVASIGSSLTLLKKINSVFSLYTVPGGYYNFNEYTHGKDGLAHKLWGIYNYIGASFNLIDDLTLTTEFGIGKSFVQSGESSSGGDDDGGFTALDISLEYSFSYSLSGTIGYSYSDAQIKGGYRDVYLFDYEISAWYVKIGYQL